MNGARLAYVLGEQPEVLAAAAPDLEHTIARAQREAGLRVCGSRAGLRRRPGRPGRSAQAGRIAARSWRWTQRVPSSAACCSAWSAVLMSLSSCVRPRWRRDRGVACKCAVDGRDQVPGQSGALVAQRHQRCQSRVGVAREPDQANGSAQAVGGQDVDIWAGVDSPSYPWALARRAGSVQARADTAARATRTSSSVAGQARASARPRRVDRGSLSASRGARRGSRFGRGDASSWPRTAPEQV